MTIPVTVLPVYGLKGESFFEERAHVLKSSLLFYPADYQLARGPDTCLRGRAQGQWGSLETREFRVSQLTLEVNYGN